MYLLEYVVNYSSIPYGVYVLKLNLFILPFNIYAMNNEFKAWGTYNTNLAQCLHPKHKNKQPNDIEKRIGIDIMRHKKYIMHLGMTVIVLCIVKM